MTREREILRERARRLAQPPPASEPGGVLEIITLTLGAERWAIDTSLVLAVVPFTAVSRLPSAPAFLVGLAAVRGVPVPVVDLGRFLGVPRPGVTDLARIVVLGEAMPELGFVVDAVDEVATISRAQLRPPEESMAAHDLLHGIAPDGMAVLAAQALAADPRFTFEDAIDGDDLARGA